MAIYLFALLLASSLTLQFAYLAARELRYPGFWAFMLLEGAVTWWILCYVGEWLGPSDPSLFFALKFLGVCSVAPSWTVFVLHHTTVWRPRLVVALALYWEVAVFVPLILTNDQHRLIFAELVFVNELIGLNGPLFVWHVVWNYLLMLLATALLVRHVVRTRERKSLFLLLGGIIPFLGNVLNEISKASPAVAAVIPVNMTLPAFTLSAAALGWGILRWRLLDPRPMAHAALFQTMPDGLWVLDEQSKVVDVNTTALSLMGQHEQYVLQRPAMEVFRDQPRLLALLESLSERHVELPFHEGAQVRHFDFRVLRLQGERHQPLGWLITARDITKRLEMEQERERLHQELAALRVRDERLRIARELHDGLGADLAAIAWRAAALKGQLDGPMQGEVARLAERAAGSLDDLRLVVWATRGAARTWSELADFCHKRCRELCAGGVALSFTDAGSGEREELQLDGKLCLDILRMLQEAVRNAIHHGGARELTVRMAAGDAIELSVQDDGKGLPAGALESSTGGLANLRERARSHGGAVMLSSSAHGACVRVSLPVSAMAVG